MRNLRYLFIALFIIILSPINANENLLIGKWRADKEQTGKLIKSLTGLKLESKYIETMLEINETEFIPFVLEVNKNEMLYYINGKKIVTQYRILEIQPDQIIIEEFRSNNWVTLIVKINNNIMLVNSTRRSNIIVNAYIKID